MPISIPTDPSDGAIAPASWGDAVRDTLLFLTNPPSCRVHHSAAQSIPDNADTTVAFNSERWDTDTMHDTATNNSRITIKTAGVYVVTFNAELTSAIDYVNIHVLIRMNGTANIAAQKIATTGTTGSTALISAATVWKMAVNDYLEVRINQDNSAGAARDLASTPAYSPEFAATWIGLG